MDFQAVFDKHVQEIENAKKTESWASEHFLSGMEGIEPKLQRDVNKEIVVNKCRMVLSNKNDCMTKRMGNSLIHCCTHPITNHRQCVELYYKKDPMEPEVKFSEMTYSDIVNGSVASFYKTHHVKIE